MEKFVPTLKKKYQEEIVSALMQEFNYKTVMQVPRLEKIVINEGLGQAISDKKLIDIAIDELTNITGQKAVPTTSKKDISNFKLRKKMQIGVRVTLRRDRMYEFLERLVAIALPRIRDLRGVNYKFDGKGNYTLGVNEQIIFPEIDIDKINRIMGMDITFVTSAKTDEEGYALLKHFGVPFKNLKKN
ncbi:MAG: 50S ribosomal protein L5 [Bacteroidales bacterium]|nr:50S ribosomal protein L5 [Bacteroidales bacterium]